MLSVANVRSAGGAAGYFAKDNYYAQADADRSGVWVGNGAERLGLVGSVEPRMFEAVLRGKLPQGDPAVGAGMVVLAMGMVILPPSARPLKRLSASSLLLPLLLPPGCFLSHYSLRHLSVGRPKDLLNYLAVDIGEAVVAATVAKGQSLVIESQ